MEASYEVAEFYKKYKAKEDESIYEHTLNLLKNLEELKHIVDIEDTDLIEKACIYHDFGKVNPLFQKRLESKNVILMFFIKFKFNNITKNNEM